MHVLHWLAMVRAGLTLAVGFAALGLYGLCLRETIKSRGAW